MTTYTFGTFVDPSAFLEQDDGSSNPPPRPAAGGTLLVRTLDLQNLPNQTYAGRTGYINFTEEDIPAVQVSGNGGTTWITLISIEAQVVAMNSGQVSSQALAAANNALSIANQALNAANQGGITFTGLVAGVQWTVGPARNFTLAQIHARSVDDPITFADTQGFATVASTGVGADLLDYGVSGGVAVYDQSGFVVNVDGSRPGGSGGGGAGDIIIPQNSDGTYPARNTFTTDPRVSVVYLPWYDITKKPTIGIDLSTAFAVDPVQGYPGDRLRNTQAAVA